MSFGGIEAGGTKWVCGIGDGSAGVLESETFPTTTPEETISRAAQFFRTSGLPDGVGVGSFGPIDVRVNSPTWGQITTTPKPGWARTDLVATLRAALNIPVAFDTDVNAAALAESRWGAAIGLDTFSYITVGTGIGGGAIVNGRLLHGLLHPELGHMRIPHDRARDPFDGVCPYHGDCFEGLASGEAIRQRWGRPGQELSAVSEVWELESEYLALGLMNVICTLSPQRIILGGGVPKQPTLLPLVRDRLRELLADYFNAAELTRPNVISQYIVPPGLGDQAGVLGAIELARSAAQADQPQRRAGD
ncbi:MAG: ROK family protein [Solirubrobacteraceae bacterium]|jgi:fructokinase